MIIFDDYRSDNCYKVQLLCELLSIDYEWRAIDILKKENRSDAFLAVNAFGEIPVLQTEDGIVITQSNAILYYLAADSNCFPSDLLEQTRVFQWQFFEQYSHEPYIESAEKVNLK